MPAVFDAYVMVDWSAAAVPTTGADSIWIATAERGDSALPPARLINPPTRRQAMAFLADYLADLVARDRTVLAGFDFAFGYPAGFARMLYGEAGDWRAVWSELAGRIRDGDDNANNRFEVAAALNERLSGTAFPFWGCPPQSAGAMLSGRKPDGFADADGNGLAELRLCDLAAGGPHPVWKLAYPGCVGSQTLMGIAHLHATAPAPLAGRSGARVAVRNWPAPAQPSGGRRAGGCCSPRSIRRCFQSAAVAHPVKDARQVHAVVAHLARLDEDGRLASLFAGPASLSAEQRHVIETRRGVDSRDRERRLALGRSPPPRPPTTTCAIREEIYRRSFATIRAEADLSDGAGGYRAAGGAADPRRRRSRHRRRPRLDRGRGRGRPSGAGRGRVDPGRRRDGGRGHHPLPACRPATRCSARCASRASPRRRAPPAPRARPPRSSAGATGWKAPSSPSATRRPRCSACSSCSTSGAPRPAVILGFPVGFVGAAESKEALIAHSAGVPFVTLRGRRGGSAIAAAAINALAGAPA